MILCFYCFHEILLLNCSCSHFYGLWEQKRYEHYHSRWCKKIHSVFVPDIFDKNVTIGGGLYPFNMYLTVTYDISLMPEWSKHSSCFLHLDFGSPSLQSPCKSWLGEPVTPFTSPCWLTFTLRPATKSGTTRGCWGGGSHGQLLLTSSSSCTWQEVEQRPGSFKPQPAGTLEAM